MNAITTKTGFHRAVALSVMARPGPAAGSDTFDYAIQAALNTIDATKLCPVAPGDAGAAVQPKALLAVIVACYVRQIYASTDIEIMLARNTAPRSFSPARTSLTACER